MDFISTCLYCFVHVFLKLRDIFDRICSLDGCGPNEPIVKVLKE